MPSGCRDHWRIAEMPRQAHFIERRRHHQDLEVLAQPRLRIERQREAEIAVEASLMEFIEDQEPDIAERGVGLSLRVNIPR
jgi:hypothetical protein